MKKLTLLLLASFAPFFSYTQVIENFDDGDLTNNPTWFGDLDQFIVNQSVLQSNGDTHSLNARNIWISTIASILNNAEWEFFVNPKVPTSGNNRIDVYLASDQAQLAGNNSGYFVRIGGTADEVALYRKDSIIETKIIFGEPGTINNSFDNPTRVKVTRDSVGNWNLAADYSGAGNNYINIGSTFDNTYNFLENYHFGFLVRYSSNNRQKYFIDSINQSLVNDTPCQLNTQIDPINNILEQGQTAVFTANSIDTSSNFIWQSDFGQGFQILNDFGKYSGTNSSILNITDVGLSEHNQPIRLITISGECIDTSSVSVISINDTCINVINDTTFITVTDTLVINTLLTEVEPPNNLNTIKVFPNPANNHITIDYGNFIQMNGYQLRIENSLGQEVFQTSITQESDYLNLNTWGGNGLYFVHIVDPQGNTIDIRKIVLQ